MTVTLSVDVGGTFTDIVLEEGGKRRFYKSLSNHQDIAQGIMEGVAHVAGDRGTTVAELLGSCGTFSCGTTAATNAILEGRTARTILLHTEGFKDVLRVREGGRENSYDIYEDFPEPLIPRHLCFSVRERVNAEGGVEVPLDDDEVRSTLRQIAKLEPEAVAVALIWSVMSADHENRIGRLIEEVLPGVPYSLSHEVNPAVGEYRRTSATALDASLKPVMRDSISNLSQRLLDAGFSRRPLFVCSNGGRTSGDVIVQKPVFLCLSGPSAAPGAALRLAEQAGIEGGNVISIDLGGTSLDVCMAVDGIVSMQRQGTIAGHVFGVPSVEISTIAAGGGSIARVDAGGMVHVGPTSAGSKPGPACYGLGGLKATLTDANLVRGLLDKNKFGGGHLTLDESLARDVIQRDIAGPLSISVEEAAALICAVAEQNMIAAVEDMTMRKGFDPRDFVLVSGGAAGGLHAANLARELGIQKVLIPRAGSVLSAYGISTGDIKFDFGKIAFSRSDRFDFQKVGAVLKELVGQGTAFLDEMEIEGEHRQLLLSAEGRYAGQVWQIPVPLVDTSLNSETLASLVERFHELHERLYSVSSPNEPVEFLEWRVQAVGIVPTSTESTGDRLSGQAQLRRKVYLRESGGYTDIAVYDATNLQAGFKATGPAVISDLLTSNFVPSGSTATVTAEGGLLIEFLKG
ncbi:hydantoinase A/oxoprolinase protein (plasmid) [Rhizobium phaseoli]|uniref:hydantoinase/oxoprolinase family protein n=1 Tax=Rhizobium phaseoli TaxID=396 RepID=UPI0007E9EB94|nr:hydantoinase/oxoprolinase family protein [Rhizobium phaseoli]ANL51043.1 hydantoinase A/oxoprolinase protein [Rhizobium phaseoli]